MRKSIERCSVCGELPVTSRTVDDGAVVWHCPNHLEGDALDLYRHLRADGWEAPPPATVH